MSLSYADKPWLKNYDANVPHSIEVPGVPDPKRGETVMAWIVKKPGDATTEQEIID